jgi:hypothetical protein
MLPQSRTGEVLWALSRASGISRPLCTRVQWEQTVLSFRSQLHRVLTKSNYQSQTYSNNKSHPVTKSGILMRPQCPSLVASVSSEKTIWIIPALLHASVRDLPRVPLTNTSKQCNGKGKAVPLKAWSGPEGYKKLRFPDFVTTAQDGGRLSALRTGCFLPPGNIPGTHFC